MSKVLVTGGAGFIGSNLCIRLLAIGYNVVAVDNLITGGQKNIKQLISNPNFTFIKHDINEPWPKNFKFKISNLKFIYHLACPTGVPNLGPLSEEMITTCSVGTRNILEVARESGAKFLFTSSSEVYGDPLVFPQEESYRGNVDTCGLRSPYEEGKRFSESLILMYVRKYNIDAKIVRVFNTYGPSMSPKDIRVIPNFLRQTNSGLPLTLHGEGNQKRTFCNVDDLVEGLVLVIEKGERGEVYNLGHDMEISIIDLARLILKITGSKNPIQTVPRPGHDHERRLPSLKKTKQLGWYPKISLEEGLKTTINVLDIESFSHLESPEVPQAKRPNWTRLPFLQNFTRP